MRILVSGDHGSKYWEEILIPGRQDKSEWTLNPEIRSANLIVAPLITNPNFIKERLLSLTKRRRNGEVCETGRSEVRRLISYLDPEITRLAGYSRRRRARCSNDD